MATESAPARKPTWDDYRARLDAAKAEPKQLQAMHVRHGIKPGKRCGHCRHLTTQPFETAGTYYKCRHYGITGGPGTDWRRKWEACGLYEERR